MATDSLGQCLEILDISEHARTIARKIQTNPALVSEISHLTTLHRSQVYRSLEELERCGLVERHVESRGTRFGLVSAARLAAIIRGKGDELREQIHQFDVLASELRNSTDQEPESGLRFVHGRARCEAVLQDLILGAKKELLTIDTAIDGAKQFARINSATALDRLGLTVKTILHETERSSIHGLPGEFRFIDERDPWRFHVVDGHTVMQAIHYTGGAAANRAQDVVLTTTAPAAVNMARRMFEMTWETIQEPAGEHHAR